RLLEPGVPRNGIDFVELVQAVPFVLKVHFLNTVSLGSAPVASAITINGGDRIPAVNIVGTPALSADPEGRPLLSLQVQNPGDTQNAQQPPGDFSDYTLTIDDGALDPRFASSLFSFRAFRPSDFDCAPVPPVCPPDDTPIPPIDYTAKDFQSFRQALLSFSSLQYPGWQERSEADFGVMFA